MADGVARLWGGAVLEAARGQGVYRALLGARLTYGAAHGATMGLVKGRVNTSGPILRRRLHRLRPGNLVPRPVGLAQKPSQTRSYRTDRAPGPHRPDRTDLRQRACTSRPVR